MNTIVTGDHPPFNLSAEDVQSVKQSLQSIEDTLSDHLVDLGPQDSRKLLKLGPKAIDAVSKTYSYTQNNPQFQPTFVDMPTYALNLDAIATLRDLIQPVARLHDLMKDTLLLSGSNAYTAALACYRSFKAAELAKAPGAGVIVKDLAASFPRRSPKPATAGKTATPAA